jgi:hypothetical protein
MGTCYSSNEGVKPRKSKPRTTSCLGSLCNDPQVSNSKIKTQPSIVSIPNIKSSYSISFKNDKLNNDLNELIEKYQDKLKIEKINYIQLYNIFMNYIYDFTKSNFVLCDTREEEKDKEQLFLKKFPQINYSIKQIERMSDDRLSMFCKFMKNKNIIFILKEESSLDTIEKFIIYFIANNFDGKFSIKKILILNEYIQKYQENNLNTYLEYLYYFIDEDILYPYSQKILINSIDIKSSNFNSSTSNYAYIFINSYSHSANSQKKNVEKDNILNKFNLNYLCHKNTEEPDIFLDFMSKFKIHYIINFIKLNDNGIENYIIHSEAKRNKINKEEKKSLINQENINIPKDMNFEEFYNKIQNEYNNIIEELKEQIDQNNCILIQFDDAIDNLFKIKLLYIFMFKITGLSFDDITNYLKSNYYDIENESFALSKKEEIEKLLIR